jgi:serine/threonine protein phosphatase PrpC
MLFFRFSGLSDVGLRRFHNEDAFRIESDKGLLVVADGMGGAAAGEVASKIFVDTAAEVFGEVQGRPEAGTADRVQEAFRLANERILARASENPHLQGMGCTAELIAISEESYVLGHVGDSRTYLFRKGRLKQITKDHTLIQDLIDRKVISPEEANKHSLRNFILRAVGTKETLAVDLIRGKVMADDLFLLCSDGLTTMVDDRPIEAVLSRSGDLVKKVEELIDLAKEAGGKDNVTIILCEAVSV